MKILGVDCATKTGWCFLDNGKVLESGVQDFTKRRGEGNGILFLRFRKWLSGLLDMQPPELIVYERAHYRGGAPTEIGVGLQSRVQELAEERGILVSPVHSATLKQFATGSGRADKEAMKKASKIHLKRDPIDDNEADAVMLAMWGEKEFGV